MTLCGLPFEKSQIASFKSRPPVIAAKYIKSITARKELSSAYALSWKKKEASIGVGHDFLKAYSGKVNIRNLHNEW